MITVSTNNPSDLLSKIKKSIDAQSIDTWSYDSDGDFTHSPEQWQYKAWLKPYIVDNELRFGIIGNDKVITTVVLYAVYHGRFAEMLLSHFDKDIIDIKLSSMTIKGYDSITTNVTPITN